MIDSADASNVYGQIQPMRLFRCDCYIDIPSIGRALAEPGQLQGIFDLMQTFAPERISSSDREVLNGLTALSGGVGESVICTGEIDEGQPTLVFDLKKNYLRVSVTDIEGDATVFGKVRKKWPQGENYPLLAVPGLNLFSRADRRRMQASGTSSAPDGLAVEGPGVTVSVVAIYR
ncbi:hypothetical protein [Protofrankia sp. BMG5.30]|uniref:DUF6414 family protein n=2 Tax=Protofrankia TaxID=2994361 RepID=UPI001C37838C|nr:hypothetical protein [Protofrankia sp. BMG5.30]